MGKGYKCGSGSSGLDFRITAYSTKEALTAAAPGIQTIGIITTVNITGWVINRIKPAAASEGMLWIESGLEGKVSFNALKRNAVEIYPVSASQYISGVWKSVEAYLYKGGSWEQFGYITLYLYRNADRNLSVTGDFYYGSSVISDGTASDGTRFLNFPVPSVDTSRTYTMGKKVNLTPFNYLVEKSVHTRGAGDTIQIIGADGSVVASVNATSAEGMQTLRIDISNLNSEYSIKFSDYGNGYDNWDLYELYLTNE